MRIIGGAHEVFYNFMKPKFYFFSPFTTRLSSKFFFCYNKLVSKLFAVTIVTNILEQAFIYHLRLNLQF